MLQYMSGSLLAAPPSNNSLGNEGSSPRTQTFGIGEANNSDDNTLISNVMVNNTEGAESLIGPGAIAP